MNTERVRKLVRELLAELGEDPEREGLRDTPRRVAESLHFLTQGYHETVEETISGAMFTQQTHNMVLLRNIELYSLCEHHLLPFFGQVHIGYIARDQVLGISKLARLVDLYARRLQLQERLTEQIAHAMMEMGVEGVGVVVEAQHLCMMMRGVQKQNSVMITSAVLGAFRDNAVTRNEFLNLIGHSLGA
ncbi:MAG: GTP cyclohydrolase I FolE [Armatimonadia bacterium]